MEKLGMRREGHMIHNCFVKGEWCDEFHYALLEADWRNCQVKVGLSPG
jgi:RimJ/RimL family protein N-acetyltransferase